MGNPKSPTIPPPQGASSHMTPAASTSAAESKHIGFPKRCSTPREPLGPKPVDLGFKVEGLRLAQIFSKRKDNPMKERTHTHQNLCQEPYT